MFERTVSFEDFNAAFRSEVYGEAPIWTAESFERHVSRHAIDLTRSPRWQNRSRLSGVALLGFRDQRAWVGGFGVVPEFRGRGLAQRYLQDVFEICRAAGVRTLELEVLAHNAAAVALYRSAGFETVDELVVWLRKAGATTGTPYAEATRDEDDLAVARIARRPSTCWQREPPSVAATRPRERIFIGNTAQPLAYAYVYQASPRSTLLDAGAREHVSAQALLDAIERTQTNGPLTLLNEPARGPLHDALTEHVAWTQAARQYRLVADVERS